MAQSVASVRVRVEIHEQLLLLKKMLEMCHASRPCLFIETLKLSFRINTN